MEQINPHINFNRNNEEAFPFMDQYLAECLQILFV
jgi:hypothetical protein